MKRNDRNSCCRLTLMVLLTVPAFALQSCKTGGDSSDDPAPAAVPTMSPGPTTTVPSSTTTTPTTPTTTTSTTTPTTPTTTNVDAAGTTSLTACLNAWQKSGITGAPATNSNFSQVRVIDASTQGTATDPAPPAAGAAASLVLLKLGAATTAIQIYGTNTWYCIDNAAVPTTVDLMAHLCTSGHAADGSPGKGAKTLRYKKDKNC